jgi:hypothetical protein
VPSSQLSVKNSGLEATSLDKNGRHDPPIHGAERVTTRRRDTDDGP